MRNTMRTTISIVAAALVCSACSFIDDFGSFSVRTAPGTDGGPRDAGRRQDVGMTCDRCGAGCPGTETCIFSAAEQCRVCSATPLTEGEACDETDRQSCGDAALECWAGRCQRRCTTDAQCTNAIWDMCSRVPVTDIEETTICLGQECDPVDANGCGAGNACYLVGEDAAGGPRIATVCASSTGRAAHNRSCTTQSDCVAGTFCYPGSDGFAECHRWCDYDDQTTCGAFPGEQCLGLSIEGPETRHLGICMLFCPPEGCPTGMYCDGELFCGVR
jgi:hypothetical protein